MILPFYLYIYFSAYFYDSFSFSYFIDCKATFHYLFIIIYILF